MNGREFKKHPYYKNPVKGARLAITGKADGVTHILEYDGKLWHGSFGLTCEQTRKGPEFAIYYTDTIEVTEP